MSKKTDNFELELKPNKYNGDVSFQKKTGYSLTCTKCGASKVAPSRLQRFDDLKMRFMAKRPHRCLHCYHRFWVAGKVDANNKRVWTLSIVGVLAAVVGLSVLGVFDSTPEAELDERISVVVPEFNEAAISGDDSSPSLASLINLPQSIAEPDDGVTASVQEVSNSRQAFNQVPEELLTPGQKAKQLVLAKQQSEEAQRQSQARVERLEKTLLPAADELESLLKVEVGYVVERWRDAWSKGDVDRYFLSYSQTFTPSNDVALDAWKAGRKFRVKPEKNIQLELSDFNIAMLEELSLSEVEFNQRYQSGSYIENSRKRLNLVKEDGTWKIVAEVELK